MLFTNGDEVEIIEVDGYCPYSYTTPGAKGTVVRTDLYGRVHVRWYTFPNWSHMKPTIFDVEPQYLKVISGTIRLSNADLKYDKIILKLKCMEAKRKELGYKTYGPL